MDYSVSEQIEEIRKLVVLAYPRARILPCTGCIFCIYREDASYRQTVIQHTGDGFTVYEVTDMFSPGLPAEDYEILSKFLEVNPLIRFEALSLLISED